MSILGDGEIRLKTSIIDVAKNDIISCGNLIRHERVGHTGIIKLRFDTFADLHDPQRSGYAW